MSQMWNYNHYWLPKLDFLVSRTMLMLYPMSLNSSFLKRVWLPPPWTQSSEQIEILLDFWPIERNWTKRHFQTLKIQIWSICGLKIFQFFCGSLYWSMSVKLYLFIYSFFFSFLFFYFLVLILNYVL